MADHKTGFKKNYLGKGKKVEGMDIVRVSIDLEKAAEFTHQYEGKTYLTFEVAKLQKEDEYGKTHTAYVSTRE